MLYTSICPKMGMDFYFKNVGSSSIIPYVYSHNNVNRSEEIAKHEDHEDFLPRKLFFDGVENFKNCAKVLSNLCYQKLFLKNFW